MTDKEKLELAIKFIKKIERFEYLTIAVEDLVSVRAECCDCGSDEIDVMVVGNDRAVDPKEIEKLQDEAWHVLADIDGL